MPMMIESDSLVSQQDSSSRGENQPSMESTAFYFKLIEGSEAGWECGPRWCPIKSTVLLLLLLFVCWDDDGSKSLPGRLRFVVSFHCLFFVCELLVSRQANCECLFWGILAFYFIPLFFAAVFFIFIIFVDWSPRQCDFKARQRASFGPCCWQYSLRFCWVDWQIFDDGGELEGFGRSLLVGVGTWEGWGSNGLIGVDFDHFAKKVDPSGVELMDKFGCFEAVGGAVGGRRTVRFTDANFHCIWMAGLEVIGS